MKNIIVHTILSIVLCCFILFGGALIASGAALSLPFKNILPEVIFYGVCLFAVIIFVTRMIDMPKDDRDMTWDDEKFINGTREQSPLDEDYLDDMHHELVQHMNDDLAQSAYNNSYIGHRSI